MTSRDREKLGEEMGFIYMQPFACFVGKAPWADFCRAGVIDKLRAPGRLDAIARSSTPAAGFSRNGYFRDGQVLKVNLMVGSNFHQVLCIGRCA